MDQRIEAQDLSFGPSYITGISRKTSRMARARRRQVKRRLKLHLNDLGTITDDRQTRPGSHHVPRR